MSKFDVILFDMDGTLVEHDQVMPQAINAVLFETGYTFDLDLREISGNTDYQNFKNILATFGCPEEKQNELAVELCQRLVHKVIELLPLHELKACPGVPALLEHLKQMPLGLLTGNIEGLVAPKLIRAGISPEYFSFGGFGDTCENRTEVAQLALSRARAFLGRPLEPQQVLIVGDTPRDVACARAIGARVLTVATGVFSKEDLAACKPDYLLDDLTDIDAVMQIVNGKMG